MISFNGLQVLELDGTLESGVTPSTFLLEVIPNEVNLNLGEPPLPPFGTLEFSDGDDSFRFKDMAVIKAFLDTPEEDGSSRVPAETWRLKLADRRWKWADLRASFKLNTPRPGGEAGNISQDSVSARGICQLVLERIGETGYDIQQVPEDIFPYFRVARGNPMVALAEMLEKMGFVISLGSDDKVHIDRIGVGPDLPVGSERNRRIPHWRKDTPGKITIHCGPTVYGSLVELQAVGLERRLERGSDGFWKSYASWKNIDDLSYKPGDGWEHVDPWWMQDVDEEDRHEAIETVYRYYAPITVLDPARAKQIGVTKPWHIKFIGNEIPLSAPVETRNSVDAVEVGGYVPPTAILRGDFFRDSLFSNNGGPSFNNGPTTIDWGRASKYTGDWEFDLQRNLVHVGDPWYRISNGSFYPVDKPTVECSHLVVNDDGEPNAYSKDIELGDGRELNYDLPCLRVVNKAEYWIFNSSTEVRFIETNQAVVDEVLDRYLNYLSESHKTGEEVEYVGLLPISPGGKIRQAGFTFDGTRGWTTRASTMHEFNSGVIDFNRRAEIEKWRGFHGKEALSCQ